MGKRIVSIIIIIFILWMIIPPVLSNSRPYPAYTKQVDNYSKLEKRVSAIDDIIIPDYDLITKYWVNPTYKLHLDSQKFFSNINGYSISAVLIEADPDVSIIVGVSAIQAGTKFSPDVFKDAYSAQVDGCEEIEYTYDYYIFQKFYLDNYNYNVCITCDKSLIHSKPELKKEFESIIKEISNNINLKRLSSMR